MSGQTDEEHGQPGRQEVGRVVDPGRGPAKVQIARVLVADHRVEGVDHLVGQGQGRTAEGGVEERRQHPVDRVFGHGLHRGPGDVVALIAAHIPTDDHRHLGAGPLDFAGGQRPVNLHGRLVQGPGREAVEEEHGFHPKPHRRMQPPGQADH